MLGVIGGGWKAKDEVDRKRQMGNYQIISKWKSCESVRKVRIIN